MPLGCCQYFNTDSLHYYSNKQLIGCQAWFIFQYYLSCMCRDAETVFYKLLCFRMYSSIELTVRMCLYFASSLQVERCVWLCTWKRLPFLFTFQNNMVPNTSQVQTIKFSVNDYILLHHIQYIPSSIGQRRARALQPICVICYKQTAACDRNC